MNFKKFDRVEYDRNTLFEVVFQARFPQIMSISTELPSAFQDKIRKMGYPELGKDEPELPADIPDEIRKAILRDKVYSFLSENADWKVSLSKDFVALTCIGNYTNYSDFKGKLERVLNAFDEIYTPSYFTRIGLRYKNIINNTVLEQDDTLDLRQDIPNHIAPEFHEHFGSELTTFEKTAQYTDENGHKAKVIHVFGKVSGQLGKYQVNEEDSYIVDIDCFSEQKVREVNDALRISDTFNETVRNIFRWSIGQNIHQAMGPKTE